MAKSKLNSLGGLVYSTDPGFKLPSVERQEGETLAPSLQKMVVVLDKRHRAGKAVTMVQNFEGAVADQEELGRKLKAFCGTGGSVKDGDIIIQGDNRDKVLQWLLKNGYALSKKR
jgi:translation initiation factor 1